MSFFYQRKNSLGERAGQRFGAMKGPQQAVMDDQGVGLIFDCLINRIAGCGNGKSDVLDLFGPFYLQAVRAIVGIAFGAKQSLVIVVQLLTGDHIANASNCRQMVLKASVSI